MAPFASDAQRKLIFARARAGEQWAKDYISKARSEKKLYIRRKRRSK